MTEQEFETLLDRWGPDPQGWPAAARGPAHDLAARSAQARTAWAAARLIAAALVVPDPVFDARALESRILAGLPDQRARRRHGFWTRLFTFEPFPSPVAAAFVLMLCLGGGVVAGWQAPVLASDDTGDLAELTELALTEWSAGDVL